MSSNTAKLQTTVGQLVNERPGRSRVLEAFGIDYCCGGSKPLAQAIREKGLDENTVLRVLDTFDEHTPHAERDWSAATLAELADHIEQTHHAYLKQELPRLEYLAGKVASRHGEHTPALFELARVFRSFKSELESHMQKEEMILFPIAVMVREHDDAGDALQLMRELTNDYTPPPGACNTYRALFDALQELEHDMHRHVHKENSILFPNAIDRERKLEA